MNFYFHTPPEAQQILEALARIDQGVQTNAHPLMLNELKAIRTQAFAYSSNFRPM